MKTQIEVYANRQVSTNTIDGTVNENKVTELELIVPKEYEDFDKKIVFITTEGIFWDIISENTYILTNAITKFETVRFYIWLTKDDIDFRSAEKTIKFNTNVGADIELPEGDVSEFKRILKLLDDEIEKVNTEKTELQSIIEDLQHKLDTDYFKGQKGDTGEKGQDGKNGENGKDGTNGKDGINGLNATINNVNTLELKAGTNITLNQNGNILTINAKQYDDTDIQNQINSVNELAEQTEKDLTNLDNEVTALDTELKEQEETLNQLADLIAQKLNIEEVPIGTIIASLDAKEKTNYLKCDGTIYNVPDYPELAQYFKDIYGRSNYFNGNGINTFGVPNLLGKFLKGVTTVNGGAYEEAGLPNIKGDFTINKTGYETTDTTANGAFKINGTASNGNNSDGSGKAPKIDFNASRSSGIYKDNVDTVIPSNMSVVYYIKAKSIISK